MNWVYRTVAAYRRLALFVSSVAVLLVVSPWAHAAAGDLDVTFGGDGRVTTDLGALDGATAIAVQPDGKIIGVGTTTGPPDFFTFGVVVRYESTGALDTTFDDDGILLLDVIRPTDVAVQDDGKIVLAGTSGVVRLNADGTLDMSFGGDGMAAMDDFGGVFNGVALQSDGKIVVAGTSFNEGEGGGAGVARFNGDGTADSSFSGDGWRLLPVRIYSRGSAVSIQANGRIVVAGAELTLRRRIFALYRLSADGSLDTSFNDDGIVRTHFTRADSAADVALQADGKIVAAGSTDQGDFALARYTRGGRLDATFSENGMKRTDFSGGSDEAHGLAIQANGRIVLAGFAAPPDHRRQANFGLARYRASGRLDRTFSDDGKKRTRFGANNEDLGIDLALQPDGRIVVAGRVTLAVNTYDFGFARYLAE